MKTKYQPKTKESFILELNRIELTRMIALVSWVKEHDNLDDIESDLLNELELVLSEGAPDEGVPVVG